jgi:coenzyme F420-reducing hydrogenase delta subunit
VPQAPQVWVRRLRRHAGIFSRDHNVGRWWSRPIANQADPVPLKNVPLYAVITAWCEADIIASTVANAFAQGCDRVFIVDNQSPDDTVARALAAGAEIGSVYQTDYDDQGKRLAEVRRVIERVPAETEATSIWWLTIDADEFPHGPRGRTLRQYLDGLDQRFRIAGARVFNHYPSGELAYQEGRHPLDFQPLCQEVRQAWCSLYHWKHPLVRWDRLGPPLWPGNGFHRMAPAGRRLDEPIDAAFLHHFQFRERDVTQRRLERLCRADQGRARASLEEAMGPPSSAARRLGSVEDIYEGRWDRVPSPLKVGAMGVTLSPWTELVGEPDNVVQRWY